MRFSKIATLASIVALATTQELSGGTTLSATSTASDYNTEGVTYNSNLTPVSISTEFSYTTGSSTRTGSNSAVTTSVSGNSTVTLLSSTRQSTVLSGTVRPSSTALNGTATANATLTATAAGPTNTVPCNGYPEFCDRKYSNITHVAAHNSPFVVPRNLASNQALDVTYQLNDGVRMLQFQVHLENGTLWLCHSSCNLLNAGTLVNYLTTVRQWLDSNQYDVITILMGNSDAVAPGNFTQPVIDAGLIDLVYIPPTVPMALDGWPTLGEMILTNKRVVMMLDYEANQGEIPWLLDEFSYMWETPFSPTDREFPCMADRPPDAPREVYETRMSMANHNLNVDISLAGVSLLVPASNILNETNADHGYGSVAWAVQNCTRDWNRPPNFLLVDYYNYGNFNGSVFAVAAAANNVNYDRSSCCGIVNRSSGASIKALRGNMVSLMVVFSVVGVLLL